MPIISENDPIPLTPFPKEGRKYFGVGSAV